MSRERDIFGEALEQPDAASRAEYLQQACGQDAALRTAVQALLDAHEQAGGFLSGDGGSHLSTERIGESQLPTEGPGSVIGRYKLLQKIGEGGFGVVYMAEQRQPVKRKVALKIIKLGMDTRQVIGRFEAERQALALMDHPNIARVYDGGATDTGRPYFVMELVRGLPITQFCDENHLSTEERLRLFIDVCHALQHAHQKGIVHRDIKPNNVLITLHDDKAVPKVIDFGIAKAMQQELTEITIFTRFHEFIGTPAYMSPEQTQLSGLDIDTRSDIYSLGVLLYELLTGKTPFDANDLASSNYEEIRRRIREEETVRPSTRLNTLAIEDRQRVAKQRRCDPRQLRRTLRGELDWIVLKALEKDRTRRYGSASELAEDIRRYLRNEPVIAVAPSVAYRFRKFARRHRAALTTALVITALLACSTVVSLWLAVRASRAERSATQLLVTEQKARRQLELERQRADMAAARAQREAATAEAVTRFLNEDLFASADPENEPDREITLRTILDRASQQMRRSLTNEPLVTAAIHTTIGSAYRRLSVYEQAQEHLRRAHELYAEHLGETNNRSLRALIDYAGALDAGKQSAAALPLAERACALAAATFGTNHPITIRSLSRLAFVCYHLKRTPEAFALAEQAYAAAQQTEDVDDGDLFSAMYLVARRRGLKSGGQFEAGEAILQEALTLCRERRGEQHFQTIRAKIGLAVYYYDHGKKLDEAERIYLEALSTQRRLLGEGHEWTLVTRDNLGLLYTLQGRLLAARDEYLQILRYRPLHERARERLPALLQSHPLPPLIKIGESNAWHLTTKTPGETWLEPRHDLSAWTQGAVPGAGECWLRYTIDLTASPQEQLVFTLEGDGEFDLFINGARVVDNIAPIKSGLGLAVSDVAGPLLRPGQNVIALHGQRVRADAPVRLEISALPKQE